MFLLMQSCHTPGLDKMSSSELSEAINSMFRWYKDAEVCYAYLSDWRSATDLQLRDFL